MAQKDEHFEFAGKTLLAKGTSGSPKVPLQQASGRPVPADLVVGGRSMQKVGTSGQHPLTGGTHRPVGGPSSGDSLTTSSRQPATGGGHRLVGGPTRIS
jgi:hypothetical protein